MLELALIGFSIGLTGAVAPGPMLFATIEGTLKNGWTAGPKVVLGHGMLEMGIFFLIALGVYQFVSNFTNVIGVIGGGVLVLFGASLMRERPSKNTTFGNPVIAGVVTSASNPYFWLWWLTAGLALLTLGLPDLMAAGVLMAGHLVADLSWFVGVSLLVAHTRSFLPERVYRILLKGCGVFLVVFGAWFIYAFGGIT